MKIPAIPSYFRDMFDKYKYIFLVCLVGVLLMVWPQNDTSPQKVKPEEPSAEQDRLESRIQTILEAMDGVGKAQVLLTEKISQETAYAYDQTDTQNQSDTSGSRTRQMELVALSQNGGQSPIPLYTSAAEYRGAVVVCEGGGSAAVRLAVTQVIQSLTGISADRIVISKME